MIEKFKVIKVIKPNNLIVIDLKIRKKIDQESLEVAGLLGFRFRTINFSHQNENS